MPKPTPCGGEVQRYLLRITIGGRRCIVEVLPAREDDDFDYEVRPESRYIAVRYSSSPKQMLLNALTAAEIMGAPEAA